MQISPIDLEIIYLLILNFENVVATFGDSLIAGTSVEITLFKLFFVEIHRKIA